MSKTERWEKEKKVKDNIGPGLYFKDRGVPMPSKPRALSYTFQKKVREGLGKGHLKVIIMEVLVKYRFSYNLTSSLLSSSRFQAQENTPPK